MMDFIIQQAKQYFQAKQYEKAYNIIQNNVEEIDKVQLPIGLDLAGCSKFMLRDFQNALLCFCEAINLNPKIGDFYINKGSTLRCLNREDQSIQILSQVNQKIINPAINYNLRILARNNSQVSAQTRLISLYQNYNPMYDKYGGLVPSFLKPTTSRSDYIWSQEQKIINFIKQPTQFKNLHDKLNKIQQRIEFRHLQLNNYGVQFTPFVQKRLQTINLLVKVGKLYTKISTKTQKQQYAPKLFKLYNQFVQNLKPDSSAIELAQIHKKIQNLHYLVLIMSEKEVHVYKNYASFLELKETVEKEDKILWRRSFRVGDRVNNGNRSQSQKMDIQIIITQSKYYLHINIELVRKLQMNKCIKQLQKIEQQRILGKQETKQEQSKPKQSQLTITKLLYNMYWLINLRIVLNNIQKQQNRENPVLSQPAPLDQAINPISTYPVNLSLYLGLRHAFQFLYHEQEVPECLRYCKLSVPQLTDFVTSFFSTYNQIFNKMDFLNSDKEKTKEMIENIEKFKNYIEQTDQTFEGVLEKEQYIEAICFDKNQNQIGKERKYFRQKFNLYQSESPQSQLRDRLVESLFILFYYFRPSGTCSAPKTHRLLLKAFAEMSIQSPQYMNGKLSFYKNLYQFYHPKSLTQKIWSIIS